MGGSSQKAERWGQHHQGTYRNKLGKIGEAMGIWPSRYFKLQLRMRETLLSIRSGGGGI